MVASVLSSTEKPQMKTRPDNSQRGRQRCNKPSLNSRNPVAKHRLASAPQSGLGNSEKPAGAENPALAQKKAALHHPAAWTRQFHTMRKVTPKLAIMTGRKKAKFSPMLACPCPLISRIFPVRKVAAAVPVAIGR